jgi:hypothetical protein
MSTDPLTGLALLRKPFEAHQINKLPKPYKADSPKGQCRECGGYHGLPAVHLDYVGHAALTDRLLEADPNWTWEPLALSPEGLPAFDKDGGLWIRLTICGITRLGYGDSQGKRGGNAVKEAIGDALRNAGMRFGAALDLWHKGDLHDAAEERGTTPEATPEAKPARTVQRAKPSSAETVATWKAAIEERTGDIEALRKLYTDAKAQSIGPDVLHLIQAAATTTAA